MNKLHNLDDQTVSSLVKSARAAASKAYAPYSGLRFGAAVLTSDGETFVGANVENASYGLTICAERSAIFAAVFGASSALEIRAIAVFEEQGRPFAPCGAGRQVISEFGGSAFVIFGSSNGIAVRRMCELLPDAFGPHDHPHVAD
jgi:cytidine deaminase